jgi:hypothetical protein
VAGAGGGGGVSSVRSGGLLGERSAVDLAVGGRREGVAQLDARGDHVVLQVVGAVAAQCGGRELGFVVRDDVGDDRLAEQAVGCADDGRHAHALGGVQDRLDLAWRDLLAARLEDVVAAPDEVQEALLVLAEEVPGRQRALPRPAAGAQPLRRRLGVVPVALHDVRAAHDQLADLAGRQSRAGVVLDPRLRAGDRDPDRFGPCVELLGRQVGDALALGQPVHRVEPGLREGGAQRVDRRRRERGGGVREEAQIRKVVAGFAAGARRREDLEDRRHRRQAADALAREQLQHAAREGEASLEDQRRADPHAHQQLVEAVVERQRHDAQHPVVAVHRQVLDDRAGRECHVRVRERDALRAAGRAGRVDDCGEVDADRPGAGGGRGARSCPAWR